MANEQLTQAVKNIHKLARSGNFDGAYEAYGELFADPAFATYRPEDQRQALKLMIYTKGSAQNPTPQMVEAHRAAIVPLTTLVSTNQESIDYEMLGICHILIGDDVVAVSTFRTGLMIERERDPMSDLCNSLMKRISQF